MPTLLDTHAWVWWVTADRRLSKRAKTEIARAVERRSLHLSMISLWELAKKVEKKQIILDRNIDAWIDAAINDRPLHLVELTRPILIDSCRLPQPFHGDPADHIIVATARNHTATLVTKDTKIRRYAHVQSIW
jgi:PIN domain nuclease of toxin-antitoxin system